MFKHLSIITKRLPLYLSLAIFFLNSLSYAQTTINLYERETPNELDNIEVLPLFSDSLSSSFLIWIKNEVKAHKHEYHSEQVYVLQGEGIMKLNGENIIIKPGDIIYIPKNTIHQVTVTSEMPMKVISIQAPIFTGDDRLFIDREK